LIATIVWNAEEVALRTSDLRKDFATTILLKLRPESAIFFLTQIGRERILNSPQQN